MAKLVRGEGDSQVDSLKAALEAYETENLKAEASLYRQNPASIRVRIIDRSFEGMTRSRRHDYVWDFLKDRVEEDVMGDISMLLLIPESELGSSLANTEFEEPSTSQL